MTSSFLVCELCGVAYDVGAKTCTNKWCIKPVVTPVTNQLQTVVKVSKAESPIAFKTKAKRKPIYKKVEPGMARWISIVTRAKRKGLDCNVTHQDILDIIELPCVYCGSTERIEVDRKDSFKGYTTDNVAPACHRCNTIKSNVVSYDEMIFIADYLGWRNGQQL